MENERYNWYKENHPDWSDEQIWTAISIDLKAKDAVKKDENVTIQTPGILEYIIRGAAEWLDAVLPDIFEKVKKYFDDLLEHIADFVQKKLGDIVQYLISLFN